MFVANKTIGYYIAMDKQVYITLNKMNNIHTRNKEYYAYFISDNDIDYINLHGTGTIANDIMEANSMSVLILR